MGTKGELKGDMDAGVIELTDFVSGNQEKIQLHTPAKGHNGSDMSMMRDFVRMIERGKKGQNRCSCFCGKSSYGIGCRRGKKKQNRLLNSEDFCK